jgi:hypothetical protein
MLSPVLVLVLSVSDKTRQRSLINQCITRGIHWQIIMGKSFLELLDDQLSNDDTPLWLVRLGLLVCLP